MAIDTSVIEEFLKSPDIPGIKLEFTGNVQSAKVHTLEAIALSAGYQVLASNGDLYLLRA